MGPSRGHRDYRKYLEALSKALINYLEPLETLEPLEHNQIYRPSRDYCVYCKENQLNWQPKYLRPKPRSFGIDLTNFSGDRGRFWGSRTQWGCQ